MFSKQIKHSIHFKKTFFMLFLERYQNFGVCFVFYLIYFFATHGKYVFMLVHVEEETKKREEEGKGRKQGQDVRMRRLTIGD